jgi:hypothetical protein
VSADSVASVVSADVQAAKVAIPATNKIANTFFISLNLFIVTNTFQI